MSDNTILNTEKIENSYGVEQISVLSDRQHVRTRPGMYIGSSSQGGIDQLIYEEIDNAVDEAVAGFGNVADVIVKKDCSVTVADHGRGMPVGPHPIVKNKDGSPKDTLTVLLTELHSGSKFGGDSGYKSSSGLHGVGGSCVNFLSDYLIATVRRDGGIFQQKFEKGIPVTDVIRIGDTDDPNDTGTTIEYKPDKTIFKQTLQPSERVNNRLKELALLNAGLRINYINEISSINTSYYYEHGISEYVEEMLINKKRLFDDIITMNGEFESPENGLIKVDIAFIYDDEVESNSKLKSFANNINTHEGGYHLDGFKNALKTMVNAHIEKKKLSKESVELKYILDGLYAVVNLKLTNAEFEGQTKSKLGSSICKQAVETVMESEFAKWSKKQMPILDAISTRALKVKEAEEAARNARLLKRQAKKSTKTLLPSKLSDCFNSDGYKELFICEGLSASGSAKNGRFASFQAVLPLRGKILNALKTSTKNMLNSETIQNLIGAIGAGILNDFNPDDSRYDKIIIFTDADVDGYHIKALLLLFFKYYMPGLIESGRVYAAVPPLYRIIKPDTSSIYLFDDAALNKYRKEHPNERYTLNRFKGLGEMNADQLRETSMSPETRTLKKITISDVEEVEQRFEVLMGKDVNSRREFINEHAFSVDISSL